MITDSSGRLNLVQEDCRWCHKPSREGHPSGVIAGKWRCSGCRGWQDDETAPDDIQLEGD